MKQEKEMKRTSMVKPETSAQVDLKGGEEMAVSHYCQVEHVDMISITLFLLVVHKTPPETIVFDPKGTKMPLNNDMAMATISKHAQFIKSDFF